MLQSTTTAADGFLCPGKMLGSRGCSRSVAMYLTKHRKRTAKRRSDDTRTNDTIHKTLEDGNSAIIQNEHGEMAEWLKAAVC